MTSIIPIISQLPESQQQDWLDQLNEALPEERFVLAETLTQNIRNKIDIAITADPNPKVLQSFPNLNWVHSLWAGIENLMEIAREQDFKIVRLVDPELASTMAESVLTWVLFLHRKIPTYALQQQHKIWQQHSHDRSTKCNIGILGMGELGRASAIQLNQNKFRVLGWSQSPKEIDHIDCYHGKDGLTKMLPQCQILVCLLPLTRNTNGLICEKLLVLLPDNASFINFSRGPIVNTADLLTRLKSNSLYHAVLDVFEQEPLPITSELWNNNRVTILPHVAATTNRATAVQIIAKNICEYRSKGCLDSFVNLERGY